MSSNMPRVALVTGGAKGVGNGIVRALHAAGHHTIVCDTDEESGKRLAEELDTPNSRCIFHYLDVRKRADFDLVVAHADATLGTVGILVNNAALTVSRSFEEITELEWDNVIAVNLRSVLFGCQSVVASMQNRKWGRVINLTSVAGQRGGPPIQGVHYISSKAGIIGATRYFAQEMGRFGVTVNAIAPGPILTDQTRLAPPDKLAAVSVQIPTGRLGTVEEVGALAAYLASDAAGFITGATMDINGGLLMR